jgi:hypothetical protein
MGISTVNSPWSTRDNEPRRNETAIMHSRADRAGGHLSRFTGKGAISPKLLRRDNGDLSLQHGGSFRNFPRDGDNRFR